MLNDLFFLVSATLKDFHLGTQSDDFFGSFFLMVTGSSRPDEESHFSQTINLSSSFSFFYFNSTDFAYSGFSDTASGSSIKSIRLRPA